MNGHPRKRWNAMTLVFIAVSVLALLVLISGLMAFIFPESGFPMLWVAFPVGPQSAPIPH